jgi:hypothetical protein
LPVQSLTIGVSTSQGRARPRGDACLFAAEQLDRAKREAERGLGLGRHGRERVGVQGLLRERSAEGTRFVA